MDVCVRGTVDVGSICVCTEGDEVGMNDGCPRYS